MKLMPLEWSWDARPVPPWLESFPAAAPVVWLAKLTDAPAVLERASALLSAEEHARLARLRLPEDRQRFLIGRGILRLVVGAHLGVPAERVELVCGPFGKPFAVPSSAIAPPQFNVSHSGNLVALAFHPAREVGVDIEQVRHHGELDDLARQILLPQDYRAWTRLEIESRRAAFFRAWTRHEAGLKTLGRGLADAPCAVADPRLAFFDLELPAGYCGTVACRH